MEQAVEFMTGIVLLALSLSFLLRSRDWSNWLENIRQDEPYRVLPIGCFTILISSFMVAFHPVWDGFFILVTIIGVLGIIEGSFYLLFPGVLRNILGILAPNYDPMIRIWGALFGLLGVLILMKWCDAVNII